MTRCSFEGCERLNKSRGLCDSHTAQRRRGVPLSPIKTRRSHLPCSADGCDRPHHGGGYCEPHARQIREWGRTSPLGQSGAANVPLHLRPPPTTSSGCHSRVRLLWGVASLHPCMECGSSADEWAYDGSDPGELFIPSSSGRGRMKSSQWPEFYMPMCIPCHRGRDRGEAARELYEYRLWKHQNPGKTLKDVA